MNRRTDPPPGAPSNPRVLVAGATGYIGRYVVRELVARGHEVVCLIRNAGPSGADGALPVDPALSGAECRICDVTRSEQLERHGLRGESFDAVISCLASRTGGIRDSWAIEHDANLALLHAARTAGAARFVLLSAICVQRPKLAFQHAKLAFEARLQDAALDWSIVRPTAFFKSVAGQIPRIQAGKPFLMFGRGDGPACKPISEADLARYIADCLDRDDRRNRILPIGGPGPALSVRARGELLFSLSGRKPRFRHLPIAMFDLAAAALGGAARFVPKLEDKAEFARIGRYYATESMLVLDPVSGEYSAEVTPEYGTETLADFYRRALNQGLVGQERGGHALF